MAKVLDAFIPFLPYALIGIVAWLYYPKIKLMACSLPADPFNCSELIGELTPESDPLAYYTLTPGYKIIQDLIEGLDPNRYITPGTGYERLNCTYQDMLNAPCTSATFDWNTCTCSGFGGGGAGGR